MLAELSAHMLESVSMLPEPPIDAPPRRRKRWRFFAIAVLVLLPVAAGGWVWASRYDPLQTGDESGTPGIAVPFHDVEDTSGSEFSLHRVITYVHGAQVAFGFALRNSGRWDVTVLGLNERNFGLFRVTELQRGVLGACCTQFEPFAAFVLHPGEDRALDFRGIMKGCSDYSPGGGVSWGSYEIRYRAFGITHTRIVKARDLIEIQIPEGYTCPEATSTK